MSENKKRNTIWNTPKKARTYLLLSALLLALPTISQMYRGYEGQFLVATHHLNGTYFERTVIYIEDHDLFSALGYVINKPLEDKKLHDDVRAYLPGSYDIYDGGPVFSDISLTTVYPEGSANTSFTILTMHDLKEKDPEFLDKLTASKLGYKPKVFTGYAGWVAFQLNYEVLRGRWHVLDYDPNILYETPPGQMWERARELLPDDFKKTANDSA